MSVTAQPPSPFVLTVLEFIGNEFSDRCHLVLRSIGPKILIARQMIPQAEPSHNHMGRPQAIQSLPESIRRFLPHMPSRVISRLLRKTLDEIVKCHGLPKILDINFLTRSKDRFPHSREITVWASTPLVFDHFPCQAATVLFRTSIVRFSKNQQSTRQTEIIRIAITVPNPWVESVIDIGILAAHGASSFRLRSFYDPATP